MEPMDLQNPSNHGIYLSVVSPAHNEAENLPRLLEEISAAMARSEYGWEIIIVDDSSTDDTPRLLPELRKKHPQLRVLSLQSRSGQTAALDAGLRRARGSFIATLDADLQNDPADIPRLLEMLVSKQYGLVNGWRANRHDPWVRLISTRIANRVRNWLTHEQIHEGLPPRVHRPAQTVQRHASLPADARQNGGLRGRGGSCESPAPYGGKGQVRSLQSRVQSVP
jgi:glycosyltransferase involved in cell wall biosynthesis